MTLLDSIQANRNNLSRVQIGDHHDPFDVYDSILYLIDTLNLKNFKETFKLIQVLINLMFVDDNVLDLSNIIIRLMELEIPPEFFQSPESAYTNEADDYEADDSEADEFHSNRMDILEYVISLLYPDDEGNINTYVNVDYRYLFTHFKNKRRRRYLMKMLPYGHLFILNSNAYYAKLSEVKKIIELQHISPTTHTLFNAMIGCDIDDDDEESRLALIEYLIGKLLPNKTVLTLLLENVEEMYPNKCLYVINFVKKYYNI